MSMKISKNQRAHLLRLCGEDKWTFCTDWSQFKIEGVSPTEVKVTIGDKSFVALKVVHSDASKYEKACGWGW